MPLSVDALLFINQRVWTRAVKEVKGSECILCSRNSIEGIGVAPTTADAAAIVAAAAAVAAMRDCTRTSHSPSWSRDGSNASPTASTRGIEACRTSLAGMSAASHRA